MLLTLCVVIVNVAPVDLLMRMISFDHIISDVLFLSFAKKQFDVTLGNWYISCYQLNTKL